MPDPKQSGAGEEAGSKSKSPEAAALKKEERGGIGARFVRIYEDYVRRLQEGWTERQTSLEDKQRHYREGQQALELGISQKQAEAWRKYMDALQKTSEAPENRQRAMSDAGLRYQSDLVLSHMEAAKKREAVHRQHQEATRAAQEEHQEKCHQAYQRFLNELQEAWQAADHGSLDAWTLAGIGHLLTQAASYHAMHTLTTR